MYLDIVISLLFVLGFYYGFSKGIIKPVIALSSVIIAILIANISMPFGKAFLQEWFELNPNWLPVVSFIILFLLAILLIRGLGAIFEAFIKLIYLNFINRCLGGLAFSLPTLMLMSIMIKAGNYFDLFTFELKEDSSLFEYVEAVFPWVYKHYPLIKEYFIGHL